MKFKKIPRTVKKEEEEAPKASRRLCEQGGDALVEWPSCCTEDCGGGRFESCLQAGWIFGDVAAPESPMLL